MSDTTSELIAQQILNGNVNKRTWGDILYNVKVYGAKGDGIADNTPEISSAITAATVDGGIVFLPPGTYITGSLTVPSNVTLWFANGAKLSVNTGTVVTINGPIEAGLHQIFAGLGTVAGSIQVDQVYPQWWGAKNDGVTDCKAAFNSALNAAMRVFVPEGVYLTSGTINIVKNGQKLIGAGIRTTQVIATTANLPIISVNNGLNWLEVSNMTIDRNVAATSGGNGVNCVGLVSNTYFNDLFIQNQYIGMWLGGTDWGYVKNVSVEFCYSDAIYMNNLSTFASCQWQLSDILCSQNNGAGISVHAVSGMAVLNLGKWQNINTFANGGCGASFSGIPSCPITGIRIDGGFFGADNNSEIFLDTYGGQHVLTNVYTEQAGTQVTGRTQTIPKSNVGSGIEITPNNTDVMITGCYGNAHSANGITCKGSNVTVSGSSFSYNGQGNIANYKNGVAVYSGYLLVTGSRFQNNQYGVYAFDGQILNVVGNDLQNNTTAPLFCAANPTYAVQFANRPATMGNVIPVGGILVGAGATGGIPTDGTINVSANIAKNNVNYTNP